MYVKEPRWMVSALTCLWLAGFAMAASAASIPEEMVKNRALYTQKLQAFKAEAEATKEKILGSYREKLDVLRQAAKQKGNLDALLEVDAEVKRFERQKLLPPMTPAPADPDLAKMLKLYHEMLEKTEMEGARKVSDYTEHYLKFLDDHQRQAVREDKLDLAKAYDAEAKATREMPDYQAAKFLIADQSALQVAPVDTPVPVGADPGKAAAAVVTNLPPLVLAPTRAGLNGEKIQPRIDPEGLYDAVRVFEGNPSIGAASGFKPLITMETGKVPLSGCLGISLEGGVEAESNRHQARIRLRTKTTGTSFVNLKILIQYFGKASGSTSVQELAMQVTVVPTLGAKGVTCEMKGQELGVSVPAVIVSVFSAEDKLLAQVASSSAVKDRGRTTFDLPSAWLDHILEDGSIVTPELPSRLPHKGN